MGDRTMSKINFKNVGEGSEVEVLVQISPNEQFDYSGIVSRISDTEFYTSLKLLEVTA